VGHLIASRSFEVRNRDSLGGRHGEWLYSVLVKDLLSVSLGRPANPTEKSCPFVRYEESKALPRTYGKRAASDIGVSRREVRENICLRLGMLSWLYCPFDRTLFWCQDRRFLLSLLAPVCSKHILRHAYGRR